MYLPRAGLLHPCFNFGAFAEQSKTLRRMTRNLALEHEGYRVEA